MQTPMSLLSKYWKIGVSLLFGVAVFLFWWLACPALLSFQEQYQLFLMDGDYIGQLLAVPDGFARCVAEYLTQYYISHALGALVLAIIFVIIHRLVWRLMVAVSDTASGHYALSFIPVLSLWLMLGDESVLLTFAIALILALATMWVYEVAGKRLRVYLIILLIPLLYWLAGPVVLMFAAWVTIRQFQTMDSKWTGLLIGVLAIIYALACILVSSWLVPYPLFRLFYGIDYYRFVEVYYWMFLITMVLSVVIPAVMFWVPMLRRGRVTGCVEAVVLLAAFLLLRPSFYDSRKAEVMEYDYLVRCQNWSAILAKADKKTPDLPMTVCATNLALGMSGQLGERLFDYYQNGTQGLVPLFERNFASILLTGEVYWQLGLVNNAQQFAFEAMEAIPNYAKSCRAVKRLAETNLVNGEYAVARKYLQMLQKTLAYHQWAERTLPLLGNEKAINEHPVYGRMRQIRLKDDFLFSERELDKIFGQLVMHNQRNGLALQYLLAAPLLNRDVNTFMNYMIYVDGLHLGYRPRSCQEAVVFAYAQRKQRPPQGYVSDMVLRQFGEYLNIYSQGGKDASQLARFKNTAWYYFMGVK
jgi:hypothetical protein